MHPGRLGSLYRNNGTILLASTTISSITLFIHADPVNHS